MRVPIQSHMAGKELSWEQDLALERHGILPDGSVSLFAMPIIYNLEEM